MPNIELSIFYNINSQFYILDILSLDFINNNEHPLKVILNMTIIYTIKYLLKTERLG